MSESKKLHLVLCWHMHQPDYRNFLSGEFTLPWTYLHAIKDYTDMAWHLENTPGAKVVMNFVPVLLDQLEDYSRQFASGKVRDPLLNMLLAPDLEQLNGEQRKLILDSCFRSNHTKMIEPYPPYRHLYNLFKMLEAESEDNFNYLSGQYLADLVVWYHLVWIGETVRRTHELAPRLMAKGSGFAREDRRQLFDLVGKLIADVIPRYKALAQNGQVELSTTPHNHPIAPLLIDFQCARESEPEAVLPQAAHYPGGISRVQAHLGSAIRSHKKRFGVAPSGVWPAEGGVSTDTVKLLAAGGARWTASGEGVLANSLKHALHADDPLPPRSAYLYRPYQIEGAENIACFFRDDKLSDLIGFEYANWYGSDAVNHFIGELENIRRHAPENEEPVVSVILDGENAWEYYPYNGYYFLSGLYQALQSHPAIQMTTYRDLLAAYGPKNKSPRRPLAAPGTLPRLAAGSWVYGTFSTWIGDAAKNRAWDLLCAAKSSVDLVTGGGRLTAEEMRAALKHLSDCEGSDWFWWFGDYNPAHSVISFDKLFRENLKILYRLLKLPPPATLDHPICIGSHGEVEAGGAMRRAS